MIKLIALGLLLLYSVGCLYYLISISIFFVRRSWNAELPRAVDVLARIMTVLDVTFFWPIHLVNRKNSLFT